MTEIQQRLFALRDKEYGDFNARLMPGIDRDRVIGVRTPELRKLSRELFKAGMAADFMEQLPHEYYEENNLHGFFIEQIKDYEACTAALERFLPYVDNWATCDLIRPKIFKKHPPELPEQARRWIASGETYTVRFGIGVLLAYYLDGEFKPEYAELAASVSSEEYYVKMMLAWYFATALAKQYDAVLPYLEQRRLDKWVHNKTIQKALESFRVSPEHKEQLKKLKA